MCDTGKLSPMMVQYMETKKQYPDCLLFYRIGDFYEMFFDDARTGAEELDLVLTGKECGLSERAPMCGIPYHAADNYISRLIKKGYRVAIGEQVEDPRTAKGLVKREVIRVVTPGTLTESTSLEEGRNNYLMSAAFMGGVFGISVIDVSTGEYLVTEAREAREFYDELNRYTPAELIHDGALPSACDLTLISERWGTAISPVPQSYFDREGAEQMLREHFHAEPAGLGLGDMTAGMAAAGAVLKYVYDTQFSTVEYITSIKPSFSSEYMLIDTASMRNLEILETMRDKEKKGSLLWVLDKTKTAMGSRMMRKIISRPLIDPERIKERQEAVADLNGRFIDREELTEYLRPVYDLERLLGRAGSGRANPLDMLAFLQSVSTLPSIKDLLKTFDSGLLKGLGNELDPLSDLRVLLENAIDPEAPAALHDGGIIKEGYDEEADRLKSLKTKGRSMLLELEGEEREKTGIRNLKIKLHKTFGYCIEVTNSFKDRVPDYYIRKQTLTTAERYTTKRLEELSSDILGADEKLKVLEYELFLGILKKLSDEAGRIQKTASALAYLDVLCSFSYVASRNKYVCPSINTEGRIVIKDGRHPVVELTLKDGSFIANDTNLNNGADRIAIITGPNMAGKSTYMRQVALIALMAQTGSFVPARSADIAVSDRIFTRVGASDDLSQGQSTFMVEMTEVANILRGATSDSLLILDEIGRGTSTYDGLSIAWAVVEYISRRLPRAKTLFATHYHELTGLEGRIKGVHNYCIAVREEADDLVFLRKIIPGGADRSYGIAVASMAGVPEEVIRRAKDISARLESSEITDAALGLKSGAGEEPGTESIFMKKEEERIKRQKAAEEVLAAVLGKDLNSLTPMEALFFLHGLKEKYGKL